MKKCSTYRGFRINIEKFANSELRKIQSFVKKFKSFKEAGRLLSSTGSLSCKQDPSETGLNGFKLGIHVYDSFEMLDSNDKLKHVFNA